MLSRRRFVQTGVAGMAAATASSTWADATVEAGPFQHGVASGDPLADRVILWTRITSQSPLDAPVMVSWQVARDPQLQQIVAEGETSTTAASDFTVKVDASLLQPATTYYYAFIHEGVRSMVGRTRTAPQGDVASLRIAVCSCSSIYSGYMNGYGRIADRNDLDLVIHCGDYIYNVPDENERRRMPVDSIDEKEPETLEEIRRRYAYYRRDPQLCRAHQQHPFVIVWDNHDIESGPKAAALQAFHEWTPIRSPMPDDTGIIYRHLSYGPLLDIFMLDTRHIGRDPITKTGNPLLNDVIDDENRSLLGTDQYTWLTTGMQASTGRWRLLGNQVMMAPLLALGVVDNPADDMPGYNDTGLILNPVQWDGYAAERRRLFNYLRTHDIRNNIVVTGDLHMSFAADLIEDPIQPALYDRKTGGASVGVEFLPTSITRGNIDEQIGAVPGTLASIAAAVATGVANPHIHYADYREHGYGIVHLTAQQVTFEFWYTPILYPTRYQWLGASLVCRDGHNHLERMHGRPRATQGAWQALPAPAAWPAEPANYFTSWLELVMALFRAIEARK